MSTSPPSPAIPLKRFGEAAEVADLAVCLASDELGIREIVRRLNAGLGPTLVAGLTGSKDRRISHKMLL